MLKAIDDILFDTETAKKIAETQYHECHMYVTPSSVVRCRYYETKTGHFFLVKDTHYNTPNNDEEKYCKTLADKTDIERVSLDEMANILISIGCVDKAKEICSKYGTIA